MFEAGCGACVSVCGADSTLPVSPSVGAAPSQPPEQQPGGGEPGSGNTAGGVAPGTSGASQKSSGDLLPLVLPVWIAARLLQL